MLLSTLDISDPRLSRALANAGWWSRTLAIIAFVFLGLFAVGMLFAFSMVVGALALAPQTAGFASLGTGVVAAVFVLYFAISFFFAYLLFRFGSAFRSVRDQPLTNERLASGFGYLATMFKLSLGLGVVMILVMLLGPLLLAVGS